LVASAAVVPYDRKALARSAAAQPLPFYTRGSPTLLAGTPANPTDRQPSRKEQADWATIYQHCESRRQALYTWRLPWWTTWGQIARYMRPDRYYYWVVENTYERGLRRDQAIVDRTATLCGDVCAAGLMAGLTDPDREWLKLGPAIPGFELDQSGKQWYEDVAERYNYVLTHCNFYDAEAQSYNDLTFFGTAPTIDYEDADEILHVVTPCAGEYMLGTGFDFSDEVLARDFRLTVSQMVEMFGIENCPPDVQKMWRQKGGALEYEYVISHLIEPNFAIYDEASGGDVGVVPGGFTWRETYWIRGKKDSKPLAQAGFHQQPFAVKRWNTQGNDAYGRGVGEYMLGDTIQLQLETRQLAESIEKVNRPPMGADVSLQNLPASTNPGKITYFNTGTNGEKKFFPLFEIRPDIPAIVANLKEVRERLALTAFNNVFQPMQNLREETRGQVTATEVDAIKEEQLMQLGPVIGRVYGSLRLRVKRHIGIMGRRGLIPPKPPSLRGVPTRIEFISMLTAAQKATRTQALARTFQFAGSISGVYPEAKFALDPLEGIREFNDGVGGDSKYVRSPQKVKQLMAAAAAQAAQAQAMEQTQQGAQAAAALSKTSLAPGNALSALVGGGAPQ
jgi:hypothetical protein